MRHRKNTIKLNRTSSHRRCMIANMLKALIIHEGIETTVTKAKLLTRYADKMISLAKKDNLAARRKANAELMLRYNPLTAKEARAARSGDTSSYNDDRNVLEKLFGVLAPRFHARQGGYTTVLKKERRVGDGAQKCIIQYLAE